MPLVCLLWKRLPLTSSVVRVIAMTSVLLLSVWIATGRAQDSAYVVWDPPPQIVSISPSFNQIASTTSPDVIVTFDVAMDSTAFDSLSFAVSGNRSGYHAGSFIFSNGMQTASFRPSASFHVGERVDVSLSKRIRAQTGDSLTGFFWEFRIPIANPTHPYFSRPMAYGGGGDYSFCVDMNNDGSADVVTSTGVILLNNGQGQFTSQWLLPGAVALFPVVVDDLNRDDRMDVVYTGIDGIKIGIGDGQGTFIIQTKPFWFSHYVIADFNSDGYPDILGLRVAPSNNPPSDDTTSFWGVSLNDGAGQFNDTTWKGVLTGWFRKLIYEDVDNDGDRDVLIISHPAVTPQGSFGLNGFAVYRNNGNSVFDSVNTYPADVWFNVSFPRYVRASDFSNDGLLDVAILGDFIGSIALNLGGGAYGTDSAFTRPFHGSKGANPFAIGDMDGDGWIDVVVSGYSTLGDTTGSIFMKTILNCNGVFLGCGTPNTFEDTLGQGRTIWSVEAADLDNDGDMDLVHGGSGVLVSFNIDSPVFVREREYLPDGFVLRQNYPNPFNSETIIRYRSVVAGDVTVVVYNLLGEEVRHLENRSTHPGEHVLNWNGKNDFGYPLPSGVYVVRVMQGNLIRVVKSLLIK